MPRDGQIARYLGKWAVLVGLLYPDLLSGKHLAKIDLASLKADAATPRHHCCPVTKRILELFEAAFSTRQRRGRWPGFAIRCL